MLYFAHKKVFIQEMEVGIALINDPWVKYWQSMNYIAYLLKMP